MVKFMAELACGVFLCGWGQAAAPSVASQKDAYMFGIRCYVANGVAVSDRCYNADGSRAAAFRASAKKAYDVIWYMGRATGHTDALIDEDIDSYQRLMSAAFLRDDAYFQRTRSDCIKLGLM